PAAVRADARVRESPRALRRADRAEWGGAGELPAGVHPPQPDLGGVQPRPGSQRAARVTAVRAPAPTGDSHAPFKTGGAQAGEGRRLPEIPAPVHTPTGVGPGAV